MYGAICKTEWQSVFNESLPIKSLGSCTQENDPGQSFIATQQWHGDVSIKEFLRSHRSPSPPSKVYANLILILFQVLILFLLLLVVWFLFSASHVPSLLPSCSISQSLFLLSCFSGFFIFIFLSAQAMNLCKKTRFLTMHLTL